MTRVTGILLLTAVCAFAAEDIPVDAPYQKVFDAWRACGAAESLAKRGVPDALRTLFLAAYVRVNQPVCGGEDLEGMDMIFSSVLKTVGDDAFCTAIAAQRPEVRSAVRWFLGPSKQRPLKEFPKTAAVLRKAPKIDWPLDKAYREN
jgi:hypothetical protein